MLMRFDPFREFDRLADNLTAATRAPRAVPLDAYRRGQEMVAEFDLPGVDPDSIDLTVERNVLTIRAERRTDRRQGDEVVVAERPEGVFTRQLFLGDMLDPERLDARYQHGVLTVTIPVAEQAKPRRISIQVSDAPATVEAGSGQAEPGPGGTETGAARQPGDTIQRG